MNTVSFAKSDDEASIGVLASLRAKGVDVNLVTREQFYDGSRTITRQAVVSWDTHNSNASVL